MVKIDWRVILIMMLFEGLPVPRKSGFFMEDYYIWCSSVIKVNSKYHMFASRWPKESGFPEGYRFHSEIVRAEAHNPEGPYIFRQVVIGKREGGYWDSQMAHNPYIVKVNDTFVLYYIGSKEPNGIRKVGYATSNNIEGPWKRIDEPLTLSNDANNPAVWIDTDGSVKLVFRDKELKTGIATAKHFKGSYTVHNFDLFPGIRLEDFFLFKIGDKYHIICEDNAGQITGHVRWGVHLESEDGINGWKPSNPLIAYNHTITWEDGKTTQMERRERPFLLFDDHGKITHLVTAVLYKGKAWCMVQPVRVCSTGGLN